jgi:co-chaperonin GroES (HSP10)
MDKTIEILLNGSRVLVRRFPIETKTDSGLILPDYISTDKEAVGTGKRLDPFQKRGEVIAIGIDCSETFKSNFTNYFDVVPLLIMIKIKNFKLKI